MEPMTEEQYRVRAEPAYRAVFARPDPFDEPFQPEIEARLVLYGYRWALHPPWLEPVVRGIRQLGESGFFVSALERAKDKNHDGYYHWYVPLGEADTYGPAVYSQQNAVYSTEGRWGIICSDEDHALIGGPTPIIQGIQAAVPDLDARVKEFLSVWKHYHNRNRVNLGWIPGTLSHIYGPERTRALLRDAELQWLLDHDQSETSITAD